MAWKTLRGAAFGILLLSAMGVYAFYVEPRWLQVTQHEIHARVGSPALIAHLTDLHLSRIGTLERKVLESLSQRNPDVIVITGDIADGERGYRAASDFLRKLRAPIGVWAVKGNWEHWEPLADENEFFKRSGVSLLVNQSVKIREDLWLHGFDDVIAGKPVRGVSSLRAYSGAFCIAIFHSPQYFERLDGRCGLALSGHTHGGQIRVPFIGPLWLPPGSGDYVGRWYEREGKRMYVSRGLGTSILPIRFLARPELAYITLKPQSKSDP